MQISHYIEILTRPQKFWLFKKSQVHEKLEALTQISRYGYPSVISSLIPFLKYSNENIQNAICGDTKIDLLAKVKSKKEQYNSLKYCDISESDIDLFEATFEPSKYTYLLAISFTQWKWLC